MNRPGPLAPDEPKSKLRFEDETVPGASPPADAPPTSGQNVQKSKPKPSDKLKPYKEQSRPSERLRHEDTAQAPDSGAAGDGAKPPPGGDVSAASAGAAGKNVPPSNSTGAASVSAGATPAAGAVKSGKKAVREGKRVEKSKLRMEKTETKLGKAQDTLAAQKPPKRPGSIKQLGKSARTHAWLYVHRKIHEAEHENVGVESAHKTELAGEGVVRGTTRFVKRRYRTRHSRRVQKLTKRTVRAKTNYMHRKLLQENPQLKKKAFARLMQKRRLKKFYQKQAKQTVKGASRLKKIGAFIFKRNPKVWLIGLAAFLLILIMQSCMALLTTLGNSTAGVVVATSYLAEDQDIDDASVRYTNWETDLQYRIINAERDHPGYDEYRFNIGDISHNPHELLAFLTAVYNDFTYIGVHATLYEIFNEQYQLEFISEMEIRTRTETRTGSGTNPDGSTYSYTYTVEVQYEWHILNVILTSRPFTEVIHSRMDEEQLQRFNILMLTKGNRQYLQSPFDFNWRPFVTSLYGYRICPIDGVTRERHLGLDIGLPEGTPILAGQDGIVTQAGDAGGYGLMVTIDNGEGLVSRYAHCSVIYVSVGQEVSAGDMIARVGSTGNSTGPHLHVEIIKNGVFLNPLLFMAVPFE